MTAVILRGDAAHLPLPDESVDLIVCSPPYWALRAYSDGGEVYDGQIGSEPTPREYIAALLGCTREWTRALKPSGSLFVNLGDAYSKRADATAGRTYREDNADAVQPNRSTTGSAPRKSLLALPWRYALGCVDELGLILRAEIVWSKPNGLPESVTDRVRRSHEQVFHFTKRPRYYSAVDEIRQPLADPDRQAGANAFRARNASLPGGMAAYKGPNPLGALPGSVWEIPTAPLVIPPAVAHARCCGGKPAPGCEDGLAHYAAFPPELCRRIILGWSPSGICTRCGEGRRPAVAAVALDMTRPQARRAQHLADRGGLTEAHFAALLAAGVSDTGRGAATQSGTGKNTPEVCALAGEARSALGGYAREYLLRRPVRFAYACACPDTSAPARPAVVVDPLGGTGTTAMVADVLGRTGITVDRSADYCRLAAWRTADPGERARALGVPKPPPVTDGQGSLFDGLGAP